MVFKAFKRIFMHSCIKNLINFRRQYCTETHTTVQVDNPPLRYVSVMSHACIAFVLVVSLER